MPCQSLYTAHQEFNTRQVSARRAMICLLGCQQGQIEGCMPVTCAPLLSVQQWRTPTCISVEAGAHALQPMFMSAAQGIREETRREQSAELKQGDVKWEVEVSLLQINLCSATAAGRFLLAAQKCQLSGSQLPASQRKALCIDMQARTICQPSHIIPRVDDENLAAGDPGCHACCSDPHTVRVLHLKPCCCCCA